jgi:hypothetical protein
MNKKIKIGLIIASIFIAVIFLFRYLVSPCDISVPFALEQGQTCDCMGYKFSEYVEYNPASDEGSVNYCFGIVTDIRKN